MPVLACRSKIRAVSDHCSLTLNAQHRLVAGGPSDTLYTTSTARFPKDVDVLLASNLIITLSGSLDDCIVPAAEIAASSLAQHLVDYFQANATDLGLNTVSRIYQDRQDGLPKVMLTSSRHFPPKAEILPVHVVLVALDLDYSWHTSGRSKSISCSEQPANHPFSQWLSLPFRTLLDNVIGRFVTWQLVRRYPLVFGPWCQQLDTEALYFPRIFSSILSIMERSSNSTFRAKCKNFIKMIHRQHVAAFSDASSSLSSYLGSIVKLSPLIAEAQKPVLSTEETLCLAMEKFYRNGMRRPQFKGLTRMPEADRADDEELSQDQCLLSSDRTRVSDNELWKEASVSYTRDTLPHTPMNLFLFGDQRNDARSLSPLPMDTESNKITLVDESQGESEHLDLDSADFEDHSWLGPGGNLLMDLDFHDRSWVTTAASSLDEDPFRPRDAVAESEIDDHIASKADQDSQDALKRVLRMGIESQAMILSTSSNLEPVTLVPAPQVERYSRDSSTLDRRQLQLKLAGPRWMDPHKEESFEQYQYQRDTHSDPVHDDLDLNILSDTDSDGWSSLSPLQSETEPSYDIEDFDEEGGVLVPVHLVSSGQCGSHHFSTLPITCPSKEPRDHQLQEHAGECGDEESRQRWAFLDTLDECMKADRTQDTINDWVEDGILVIDF